MKRITNWINAVIDRGGKRAFLLNSLIAALSMLFMWPYLIWLALKELNEWIHDMRPAAVLLLLIAPFFFWTAPLLVWMRNRAINRRRNTSFEEDL